MRLQRLGPYARGALPGVWAALSAAAVGAATEPLIPALLKPLLDEGFSGQGGFPLTRLGRRYFSLPARVTGGLFRLTGFGFRCRRRLFCRTQQRQIGPRGMGSLRFTQAACRFRAFL